MSRPQEVEPEFVQMFVDDALVKLAKMGEQLLELERGRNSEELLASLCRDTHSLKGAAGMVGLDEVAEVAHAIEDPLQKMRQGELAASSEVIDRVLAAFDGFRKLVAESVTADAAEAAGHAEAIIAPLRAAEQPAKQPAAEVAPPKARPPAKRREEPSAAPLNGASTTMQVAIQRLDQIDGLVSESAAAHLRVGLLLAEEFNADPDSVPQYRELARLLGRLQEVTMRARMVPLATITPNLHRAARDIARITKKEVRWEVQGEETEIDRKVLELLADPLTHLVRNCVDHGLEPPDERRAAGKPAEGVVRLEAMQRGSEIVITLADDGRGVDAAKVRAAAQKAGFDTAALTDTEARALIFTSGVSTADTVTEISGRGVGMDVVRTNLEKVRGRIDLRTEPGKGTEFTITVPITLTIVQCLVVEAGGQSLAIPMQSVAYLLPAGTEMQMVVGRPTLLHESAAVEVSDLAALLGLTAADAGPIVVLKGHDATMAFRVGRLAGHRDIVIKGLSTLLPRNDLVAGAAIEADGSVVVVLNVDGLVARAQSGKTAPIEIKKDDAHALKPSIVVADDSLMVRELQRSILERAGYSVRLAANGQEALALLLNQRSDLVLTDLEMPAMDGIALTEAIRRHPTLGPTPVVILTSHAADADRKRGIDAGANAYIIKSRFDQQSLLSLVETLLLGGSA